MQQRRMSAGKFFRVCSQRENRWWGCYHCIGHVLSVSTDTFCLHLLWQVYPAILKGPADAGVPTFKPVNDNMLVSDGLLFFTNTLCQLVDAHTAV